MEMKQQYTAYEKLQYEEMTGAGHVIQCLKKLGVTTVFGIQAERFYQYTMRYTKVV